MVLRPLGLIFALTLGLHAQEDSLVQDTVDQVVQDLDNKTVKAIVSPVIKSIPIGSQSMHREEMRLVPGSMSDPMRSILTLPGVEAANDVSVLPFVRGGDWTETRVFWNEVPLINPFHSLSAFSVFTLEGTESIDLYMGSLPARGNGSLSGSLWVHPREAKDSLRGKVTLDAMRFGAWLQIPLAKDWNLDLSGQTFYYDWTQKAVIKTVAFMSRDSATQAEIDRYAKFVQLPTFFDGSAILRSQQGAANWEWSTLFAGDRFHVLDQRQVFNSVDSLLLVDTLALVQQSSLVQKLSLTLPLNGLWTSKTSLAWQMTDWDVLFNSSDTDQSRFDRLKQATHVNTQATMKDGNFKLETGLGWDMWMDKYDCHLRRPVYKLLMEGNGDPMDLLGQFDPNGFVLSSEPDVDQISDLLSSLQMYYQGRRTHHEVSAYVQGEHQLDFQNTIELGIRLENDLPAQDWTLTPRLAWTHLIDRSSQWALATGIYAQKEYPFYYRESNPKLLSEKSWQGDLEYRKSWGQLFNVKAALWGKKYWDLVSIKIKPVANINLDSLLQSGSALTGLGFAKQMTFDNAGTGYALGSELSSEYQPFKSYRGRLSFEWGLSRRGDDLTRQDYSFAKFRDWKLKWFHHFQFGEKYALSLRFAAGRGFPYTGYWLPGATEKRGDTTLVVESRLNRHFSPYRRLDIRFSHKDTFWGLPTESYFEVWNAWNTPNAFLRDEQTAQLRSFDLNTPVPLLFGGWELSF